MGGRTGEEGEVGFLKWCWGTELIKIIEVELRERRFKSEFKCLVGSVT
jgi:hypothetical protein